ncbi:transcriptional regulator with XRE-family HTH domain [Catenuloplanes nepalensis]|uniref:Transcriptional regulator with XRE-family HTH domain n=1 Tax=Catenuloplanes nepalensis TaxID=587533 RepID=A0ABT9N7B8_9ACTN|nr:helix-turn-helix domain-containing protein [Catenuloplanes nepalensis]MDP9799588.1 transcriptional regulator with XRE-family HTH domain [Catenuloplanes nepalensis]
MDNRAEVSDFLTTRRARISPAQAGLPVSGRRRVPGLRRSEVASLAGISAEYYAQLERGVLRGASAQVLQAVAGALRLDDTERAHLVRLAAEANGSNAILHDRRRPVTVRPSLRWSLDAFAAPATLVNSRTDLVAANGPGRALLADAFAGSAGTPNVARYVFLDGGARRFFGDWAQVADVMVGNLRTAAARDSHDPGLRALLGELSAGSAEFRRRWESHVVDAHDTGIVRIHHHVVGDLTLAWESLDLRADDRLTMTLYTAEPGSASADSIGLLASWGAAEHSQSEPPMSVW